MHELRAWSAPFYSSVHSYGILLFLQFSIGGEINMHWSRNLSLYSFVCLANRMCHVQGLIFTVCVSRFFMQMHYVVKRNIAEHS